VQAGRLIFRLHAIRRTYERGIGVEDVRYVVETGEVVEEYPDDPISELPDQGSSGHPRVRRSIDDGERVPDEMSSRV